MSDRRAHERQRMVDEQIVRRGIRDPRVLAAMSAVPRHLFVPYAARDGAYADRPLAIGHGQTISQPYMVALMTSSLELREDARVLDVGTGSGYQAAILSLLVAEVHTIEIVAKLATRAARVLQRLACKNIIVHTGDGSVGWMADAPYDGILVAAASPMLPAPLLEQLADGGRTVIPIASGEGYQQLTLVRKSGGRVTERVLASVAFVPLHGRYGTKS